MALPEGAQRMEAAKKAVLDSTCFLSGPLNHPDLFLPFPKGFFFNINLC